jgi:hypothetical protein
VSLSQEPAYSDLKNHFVCGYRNIIGEKYAGNSGTHGTRGNAVDTTNGAGPHNIQMFVMNPDGTVLHCLPGYWNPQDLTTELTFARQMNSLYLDNSISPADKLTAFRSMQINHIHQHSPDMVARSKMQSFDMKHEAHRTNSDAVKYHVVDDGSWGPGVESAFKTTDEIMHERMAKRPFLAYDKFDVGAFADYGTSTYDKHEDSLDESGRLVGDHEVHWIKNGGAHQGGEQQRARSAFINPKLYVRTYGQLKQTPASAN